MRPKRRRDALGAMPFTSRPAKWQAIDQAPPSLGQAQAGDDRDRLIFQDSWEARKYKPVRSASGKGRARGDTAHAIKDEAVSFFSVGQRDV